jgi:hypothetical protein
LTNRRRSIIDSASIEPGKDSYSIGPTLAAEMHKPPFRPGVAGRIAFFFGPIAGALVSVISLRRMGYPVKAKRVFLWTLVAASILAIALILTPDIFGRVIGFAAEIAFYMILPRLQENEFAEWQAIHIDPEPSNGWNAVGWGFAGLILFLLVLSCFLSPSQ